jgi:hypothetical protein
MTTTSEPLLIPTDAVVSGHFTSNTMTVPASAVNDNAVTANAKITYSKLQTLFPIRSPALGASFIKTARSPVINIDNGSGTTIDTTILRHPKAIEIVRARIVYDTETAGTVAAGNAKIGTTVSGAEVVAATAYTNSATVGSTTAMTLVDGTVAAATPVIFRHTGVAATAAGEAHVEIDYYENDTTVFDYSEIVHICHGVSGAVAYVEVVNETAPTGGDLAHTVDVQIGNASTSYTTALSSVITMNSSSVDKTPQAGTVNAGTLADGDSIKIVVATSGSTGTQGKGLCITVWVWENPLTT